METQTLPKTVSQQVAELTGKTPQKVRIFDKACCVRVKFNKVGTSRKIPSGAVETDSDRDLIRVSKTLYDSSEMKAVKKFDGEIRAWIYSRCLSSYIDDGLYFISLQSLKDFDEQMKKFEVQRAALVESLVAASERIIDQDKNRLRSNFRESDYKSPDALRKAFSLYWRYVSFVAPKSLEAVSEDLYKKAQDQINADIADATAMVRYALREEMKSLVDWTVNRLTPDEGGKKKIFRSKTKEGEEIGFTAKMKDFLSCFQGRNITEDAELQQLVQKAQALMAGVDPEKLRTSDMDRDYVRAGFEELKAELDTMVKDAPLRAIEVD
jgi:hypothetical protein